MKYLKYLNYIARHKWYVMNECFKEGLIWRGIVHDMSKLLPSEFIPYANFFYKEKNCDSCEHVGTTSMQCSIDAAGVGDGTVAKNCKQYSKASKRDKTGYYKATDTGDKKFDHAWFLHQKRNKHHWQYWVMPEDTTGVKILNIPNIYMREMVCDWIGAGKAQGKFSPNHDKYLETRNWYDANKDKLQLSLITRRRIEYFIGYY